jgi:hypothetical protein
MRGPALRFQNRELPSLNHRKSRLRDSDWQLAGGPSVTLGDFFHCARSRPGYHMRGIQPPEVP